MSLPFPQVEEKGGKFFARWSHDDAEMRSRNRSVLEMPDRIDTVDDAFLAALRSDDGVIHWKDRKALLDLRQRLETWRRKEPLLSDCAQIVFRLTPPVPVEDGGKEAMSGLWRLETVKVPSTQTGLFALGAACRICMLLRGMTGTVLELEQSEAEMFLRTGAAALKAAGYGVELPQNLVAEIAAEAVIAPESGRGGTTICPQTPSKTLRAKVVVRVAGEKVTRREVEFLLDQGTCTVFFRGRWIEVDRNVLKSALKVLESDGAKMTEREAVSFAFGFQRARGLASARVKGTGWFGRVLEELRAGNRFRPLAKPKGFKGELRDYQRRGYSWLTYLTDRGFGALLADDMGLGKTVQTIAWLLKRKENGGGRALIVAPVSVTMNWMRELARFAPRLTVILHQGRERLAGGSFARAVAHCDVVVTGYPLFVKDFRMLAEAEFGALVLDEAQTIKNPDTRMARTARSFPCADRLALTGTPFENRVTDLWSLEEFLNAGLLGPRGDFVQDFETPLREGSSTTGLAELKKVLAPFLLRRLKTDPGIASELGPKREVREYCVLSPRQRAAYEVALGRYANAPRGERGGKGRVLALLTELKLICDGVGNDGRLYGGKVDRLVELLESIFDVGESVLVFTQYVKVGERIRALIAEKFGRPVPFLHGGLSPAEREAQIAAFNAAERPTAFVLSLKAGGFGLNLTKATHVIHYDRWWNPSIENQATDRAHRIGQARTVFVHLFISHGTLEDRIDALLEEKRAIAGELVASGESFLLKMGDDEFARTISLS